MKGTEKREEKWSFWSLGVVRGRKPAGQGKHYKLAQLNLSEGGTSFVSVLKNIFFKIEILLIYNGMLVSGVQQSDLVYILFLDSFPL